MPTLLEKAMKEERGDAKKLNGDFEERLELALAYINDKITITQAAKALETPRPNCHNSLRAVLLTAARRGLIRITKV